MAVTISNIKNEELRKIALRVDADKNGKLDNKEIEVFKSAAEKAGHKILLMPVMQKKGEKVNFFDEKWSGHQIAKLIGDNTFTDWLQDKDKKSTDGKDDGKLSVGEGAKCVAKGFIGGIAKLAINHPVMTIAAIGVGSLISTPVLATIGTLTAIYMVGDGIVGYANAKNDKDAKMSLENVGTGASICALPKLLNLLKNAKSLLKPQKTTVQPENTTNASAGSTKTTNTSNSNNSTKTTNNMETQSEANISNTTETQPKPQQKTKLEEAKAKIKQYEETQAFNRKKHVTSDYITKHETYIGSEYENREFFSRQISGKNGFETEVYTKTPKGNNSLYGHYPSKVEIQYKNGQRVSIKRYYGRKLSSEENFEYDSSGKLIKKTVRDYYGGEEDASNITSSRKYKYNAQGNVIEQSTAGIRKIKVDYTPDGKFSGITEFDSFGKIKGYNINALSFFW